MDGNQFFEKVMQNIDLKVAELIKGKLSQEQYIGFWGVRGTVTERVRGVFEHDCGEVPRRSKRLASCPRQSSLLTPSSGSICSRA